MNKILITGAGGYIGKHVIKKALQLKNYNIVGVDINPLKQPITCLAFDFLQQAAEHDLYEKLGSPDIIIHLAWKDGFNHNSNAHFQNLSAHYEFIKNMIEHGCKNISIMGSMHEIGYYIGEVNNDTPCNPMSPYGIAKNALRQAVMMYSENKDVSVKWLRAFYITGDDAANNSIFSKILQMSKENKKTFPFTDGLNKYDFLDIDILAQQIVKASIQNNISGIINICSGEPVSLKEKVELFITENKLDIQPEYGAFKSRKYDSSEIYGNADIIKKIMENE